VLVFTKKENGMNRFVLVALLLIPSIAFADATVEDVSPDTSVVTEVVDVVDPDTTDSDVTESDAVSDSDTVPSDTASDPAEVSDVSTEDALDVSSGQDIGDAGDVSGVPTLTPEKDSITQEDINFIIQAVKEENWMLLVGLILTFLVLILDKWINIKQWVGEKGLPWTAASLGIVSHIGIALSTGTGWITAIITGILSGASAVGLWNLIGANKKS